MILKNVLSSMESQPKVLALVYLQLMDQIAWQEVALPAHIVEAKLVSMTLIQKLCCPFIVYHLALSSIVQAKKNARLYHSCFCWISFSLVSLDLLLDLVRCVFAHSNAC